jgi:hypothetical protein
MKTETTKPAPVKDAWPVVTVVYLGVFVGNDDKLYYRYQLIDGDKFTKADEWAYSKRLLFCMPGAVFEIETKDGQSRPSTAHYLRQWHDQEKVIQWQAESRAIENAREEAKVLKEILTHNAALERLEPFRRAYFDSSAKVRRQILAEVIRYITGGH